MAPKVDVKSPQDIPMQAQTGCGDIVPTNSQLGTGKKWVFRTMIRPLYTVERTGTHCTGNLVASRPAGTALSVIGAQDHPPSRS
jgi:hypothetical protein